ncbi:MAG: hypothetical protein II811_03870 [Spirochaetaceae bacterium]|nr:hypothetical protein [Spirochaetaceae bacterium]
MCAQNPQGGGAIKLTYWIQAKNVEASLLRAGTSAAKDGVVKMAQKYFLNERLLARENQKTAVFADIKQAISSKQIDSPTLTDALPSEFCVILTIEKDKESAARAFFENMLAAVNEAIFELYRPSMDIVKNNASNAVDTVFASDSTADAERLAALKQHIAEAFKNTMPALSAIGEGEAEPKAEQLLSAKKIIIVLFAALFLAVFLAFALNAVENIKQDPAASKKIKDAWIQGK